MDCIILAASTLFLLFPIFAFSVKEKKPLIEIILVSFLTVNLIISFLFWVDPIKNSTVHFYDGLFGKISYALFAVYILFIKNLNFLLKTISIGLLLSSLGFFYYSNELSSQTWCSDNHIICHAFFHLLIAIGCGIAFI